MFEAFFLVIILFESCFCAPPDIANLPTTVTFVESRPASTASTADSLFSLDVTDPENDTFSCITTTTTPSVPGAFTIQDDGGTLNFYLNSNPPFKFSLVQRYTVKCTCTDSNGEVSTGDVTVNLSQNPRPDMKGLPKTISVSETASVGDKVDDLVVTDADSFYCVITSPSPTADSFYLSNVTNYQIHVAKTLTAGTHTINMECCDDWGCSNGALTVTVTPNPPPAMTGYPTSVQLLESVTGGISVHTVAVTDDDSFGCAITTSPTTSDFNIDGTTNKIDLIASHKLKYADQQTYTISINCSNANSYSTGTLTVNILPNTRPVITAFTPITISDSQTARVKLSDVVVTETDTYSCTGSASSRASVESTGGTPAYAVYLLANADLSVNSFTVDVNCSDNWGYDVKTLTVTVQQKTPPAMTGLPTSVSIVQSDAGGNGIYTIQVTDTETFTCSGGSNPFTVLESGGDWVVHLSSTHSLAAATTHTVTVTCTNDSGKSSTGTVTINVLANTPPDIQSAPFSGTVTNGETARRLLQTFVIVDTENDAFTCSMTGPGPFSFIKESGNWRLYLDANADFGNPIQQQYSLSVTCSDDWGSSTGSITINVVDNTNPVIDGLPTVVQIIESDAGGSSIYTVTVTDAEGDAISCLIDTVDPNSAQSFFTMVKSGADYQVHLVAGHTIRQETTPSVKITIKCQDSNPVTANLTVTVQPNSPPSITSLPAAGSYIAGTGGKTKVHDLVATDSEGDNFVCTQTVTPTPAAGTFLLENTGTAYEVYVGDNPTLSASSYEFNITCQDNFGSSSKLFTLSITPNTPSALAGVPATVTVDEIETASKQLLTFTVTDAESQDVSCSLVSTPPGPFSVTQPTYAVNLNSDAIDSLDGKTNPLHTVNVTCTDTAGGSTSGIVYVQVTPNEAAVISALPDRVEVSENQAAEDSIWTLAYTDPETDPVTCDATIIPAGPFDFRTDNKLYVQNAPNLVHDTTSSYEVVFTCTNYHGTRTGRSSNATLTIDIIKNRAPLFTSANSTTRDALNTPVGTTIFTCVTSDLDGDTVTYNVTLSPTTDSISFNPSTCQFIAVKDFKLELVRYYKATITAFDGKAATVQQVGISLTNVNTAPILTSTGLNQKTTVHFPEDTATDSLLYTPVIYDPDAGQTPQITWKAFPDGEEGMFDVSTNAIKLKNGRTFDYETNQYYKLTMYVSDGCVETGPYYLEIYVTNTPEVCGFQYTEYEASTTEDIQGGGLINIGLSISDEDDPADYHTYSLVDNVHSQYFDIDRLSGQISFKVNYDIDTCGSNTPSNLARNATIIVRCTDKFGLTGTATVTIFVNDKNDNAPFWPNGGVLMYTNQYTQPGCIGYLNATDCDWDVNAVISYSEIADLNINDKYSPGKEYFTITGTGCVVGHNIDHYRYDNGTTHKFLVLATDHGNPRLSSTTELTIIHRAIATTTTTTTQAPNTPTGWWDKVENLILVAVLALLALFLLGLLAYLCCRRGPPCKSLPNCKKCWKPRAPSKKVVTPKKPPGDKFKFFDANDNKKEREMFATHDIEGNQVIPNMKF